ncbi:glutaminyl-peptide cyclotransferase [Novosphingobium beihaiensis]|uniref:Glutaminyl-peptide cyclotransferase n=1 Tax=Novosphingobium beihaiensis TaxID=2930389 RepID=A0ABT0BTE5_9SPHN|nr:glutaminyl-peptide cyclotransferase [Novosphingobium beihaiensis]MCJ2188317.1 glutaminyl-peptide cyclotransferase [Novosphingobium beihaiensis]
MMDRFAPVLRLALAALILALVSGMSAARAEVPVCGYRVVKTYPHDPSAFTEGLFYADGSLFESTGKLGQSRIFKRSLADTKPLVEAQIDPTFFGEGIVLWKDQIISLTWRDGLGYRWDSKTLKQLGYFRYAGEGWAMTIHDGTIYQSDGSSRLRLRDPETMEQTGSLAVTDAGEPVRNLNELEWIDGEIWANVWLTDRIARIDPATGHVTGWIDFTGLRDEAGAPDYDAVLNGIAYDPEGKRIFVTGKNWSKLFQVEPDCGK